jgi:hypothetical protein
MSMKLQQVLLRLINSYNAIRLRNFSSSSTLWRNVGLACTAVTGLLGVSLGLVHCFDTQCFFSLDTKSLLESFYSIRVESNFGFGFLVYNLNTELLTKELLVNFIRASWKIIFPGHGSSNFAAVYITIKYEGGVLKSLGKASKVNVADLERYISYLTAQLDFKSNHYLSTNMLSLYFAFKILNKDNLTDYKTVIHDTVPASVRFASQPHGDAMLSAGTAGTATAFSQIFGYNLPNNCNLFT